jgi:hypothetical protein
VKRRNSKFLNTYVARLCGILQDRVHTIVHIECSWTLVDFGATTPSMA